MPLVQGMTRMTPGRKTLSHFEDLPDDILGNISSRLDLHELLGLQTLSKVVHDRVCPLILLLSLADNLLLLRVFRFCIWGFHGTSLHTLNYTSPSTVHLRLGFHKSWFGTTIASNILLTIENGTHHR